MLKKILIALAIVVVAILAYAATKPDTFRYERSAVIEASPSAVFAELNNPKRTEKWSPWVEMDPEATYSYSGPASGVGAGIAWDGKKSGAGTITISESRPNEFVKLDMMFIKPMAGPATVEYTLAPDGNGTRVGWAMYGPQNYLAKLMGVFMDCEKMVGDTTMKGFENLNNLLKK